MSRWLLITRACVFSMTLLSVFLGVVLAWLLVFARRDSLLLDGDPGGAEGILAHLDFYRIHEHPDLEDVGVTGILDEVWDGAAVLLVEWPEPLLAELGTEQRRLELLAVAGENPDQRRWCLRGIPEVPAAWQEIFNDKPEGGQC